VIALWQVYPALRSLAINPTVGRQTLVTAWSRQQTQRR